VEELGVRIKAWVKVSEQRIKVWVEALEQDINVWLEVSGVRDKSLAGGIRREGLKLCWRF